MTPFPELSFPFAAPLTSLHLFTTTKKIDVSNLSSSLAVLNFTEIPIDMCFKALILCQNLEEFSCCEPSKPEGIHSPSLSEPVILSRLKFLEWTFLPGPFLPWNRDFLTYVHVPALDTFWWAEDLDSDQHPHHDFAPGFLNRLPVELKALRFTEISHSSALHCNLIDHIRGESWIESIYLWECSESFLVAVLRRLRRGEGGYPVFPTLVFLRVVRVMTEENDDSTSLNRHIGVLLAEVLERRRLAVPIELFTFCVNCVPRLDFGPDTATRFQRLIDGGFVLRILHDPFDPEADDSDDSDLGGSEELDDMGGP
ncbi:hypothetical protein AN958_02657 [Leucoagaricus sp. SymC.cos]|nr:hypothetical protein AN958_02657 [Leucoagaricus sp. SymC.cos]